MVKLGADKNGVVKDEAFFTSLWIEGWSAVQGDTNDAV